jgi:hypothetical protein
VGRKTAEAKKNAGVRVCVNEGESLQDVARTDVAGRARRPRRCRDIVHVAKQCSTLNAFEPNVAGITQAMLRIAIDPCVRYLRDNSCFETVPQIRDAVDVGLELLSSESARFPEANDSGDVDRPTPQSALLPTTENERP